MKKLGAAVASLLVLLGLIFGGSPASADDSETSPPATEDIDPGEWDAPEGEDVPGESTQLGEYTPPFQPAPAAVPNTYYYMINLNKTAATNYKQKWLVCYAVNAPQTCSFSKAVSATKTITVALGASRSWASGQLGWSNSTSVTLSSTCQVALKKGQSLVAYPYGVKATYKIRKTIAPHGSSTNSGTLTSFAPQGVTCRVE